MLASPMMTCSRRYFSGSACGSSRVLMIGRLSVVSRPTSTSKKSARWLSWNPVPRPSAPIAPRPAHARGGHEERGQVPDDVGERGGPPHQVVLVGAVGGALVVGVVLVELDRRGPGDGGGPLGRLGHDPLPRPVPDHYGQRVRAF